MRRHLAPLFLCVPVAVFIACVGDDNIVAGTTGDDGGPSANDGSPGNDGSSDTDTGAPDGSAPDADAATTFDVRSMAGLRLWLESTQSLVTEAVGSDGFGSWSDSSGYWDASAAGAPDGGKHVALPFNVNPPSIVPNGFAGRPTVSFVTGNGYLQLDNHADWDFGLGEFLIVSVAKITANSGPLWFLHPNATAGSEETLYPDSFCFSYGMGVTDGCTAPELAAPSTDPHVFVARRKADVITLRIDGAVQATIDRTGNAPDIDVNLSQPSVFIGNGVTMQVSEVIVIVGPTTDASLAALETSLKGKYTIP